MKHRLRIGLLLLLGWLGLQPGALAQLRTAGERGPTLADLPATGPTKELRAVRDLLRLAQTRPDPRPMGDVCYRLGKLYRGLGNYHTAQYWFLQAQRRWEPLGPSADLVRLHVQFGSVFGPLRRPRDVFEHAHRALSIARQLHSVDSTHCLMSACMVLAGIHRWDAATAGNFAPQLSPDSAYRYLCLGLNYARLLDKPDELAGIHRSIAEYWTARQDYRRALPYLRSSLAGYVRLGKHHNTAAVATDFAHVLLAMGKISLARMYLDSARREYKRHGTDAPALTADLDKVTAQLYRQTGQYRLADGYQRRAHEARLKAVEADRDAAVARLSVEFETEKREAKIKSQQQDLALRASAMKAERQKTYAVAGLLVLALGASLVFFRLNQKNRRISQQNAELVLEQSHRVKNHLQSVQNVLSLQSIRLSDEAARQAVAESQLRVQAIGLLHQQLYGQPKTGTTVALETYIPEVVGGVLRAYGLDSLRPDYCLTPVGLPADIALPLGLILTELITNACKYAFPDDPNPRLMVKTEVVHQLFRLVVHDKGPGFPISTGKAPSYGMRLIELQVAQLHGHAAFANEAGTRFSLTFPLKTHEHPEHSAG